MLLSPPTDERIARAGIVSMSAETCFPVKVFHGHVHWLLERAETLFLPNVITLPTPEGERGLLCPYVEGSQFMVKAALGIPEARILRPTLHLAEGPAEAARDLLRDLPRARRPSRAGWRRSCARPGRGRRRSRARWSCAARSCWRRRPPTSRSGW